MGYKLYCFGYYSHCDLSKEQFLDSRMGELRNCQSFSFMIATLHLLALLHAILNSFIRCASRLIGVENMVEDWVHVQQVGC